MAAVWNRFPTGQCPPVTSQPGTSQPVTGQPVTSHPGTIHPVTGQPGTSHRSTRQQSTRHQSTSHQSTRQQSTRHQSFRHQSIFTRHQSPVSKYGIPGIGHQSPGTGHFITYQHSLVIQSLVVGLQSSYSPSISSHHSRSSECRLPSNYNMGSEHLFPHELPYPARSSRMILLLEPDFLQT